MQKTAINIILWRIEDIDAYCNYITKRISADDVGKVARRLKNFPHNLQLPYVEFNFISNNISVVSNIIPIPKNGPIISLDLNLQNDLVGVIFMADLEDSYETLIDMEMTHLTHILSREKISLSQVPLIIQYNKNMQLTESIKEINRKLNKYKAPYFESQINHFETSYKSITQLLAIFLQRINSGEEEPSQKLPPRKEGQASKETVVKKPKDRTEVIIRDKKHYSEPDEEFEPEDNFTKKCDMNIIDDDFYNQPKPRVKEKPNRASQYSQKNKKAPQYMEEKNYYNYPYDEQSEPDENEEPSTAEIIAVEQPAILHGKIINLPVVLKLNNKKIFTNIRLDLSDLILQLGTTQPEKHTNKPIPKKQPHREEEYYEESYEEANEDLSGEISTVDTTEVIFKK